MDASYRCWLAAFRRAGFALSPQAESLAMPTHALTQRFAARGVSPYCAALWWFGDEHRITALATGC